MAGHELLLQLLGGIALLLWATRLMQTGIMRALGGELRRIVARATSNSVKACASGLSVALILQSSTAVALLVITFAERSLISLQPALALMLGADIGSTLVVQILSFDISRLTPVLLIAGVGSFMMGTTPIVRQIGRAVVGLALLLIALKLIGDASEPLRSSAAMQVLLGALADDPILAVVFGAAFTWLIHSSVAAIILFITLATSGTLPVSLGLALVLGANLGSGLVCMGLTVGKDAPARRIPIGNLAFRAIGVVTVLPLIAFVMPMLETLDSVPARQMANFHTGFNLLLAAVFLPLTFVASRLLEKFVPDQRQTASGELHREDLLDASLLEQPTLALACARREVIRMADLVETMLSRSLDMFEAHSKSDIKSLQRLDDEIDESYTALKLYLTEVSRNTLSNSESKECVSLIAFTTDLEHIGDIIDKNLLELASKRQKKKLSFSEEGWQELQAIHGLVLDHMRLAMSVFVSRDPELAEQLLADKKRFREFEANASESHLNRLRNGRVESIETSAIHLDVLRDFKRIVSHLTSIAYAHRST